MARLLYNNATGRLGALLTDSGTTITFAVAPIFATLTGSDYIPLILDPPVSAAPNANFEISHLTAYTAGALTGTISRGQEGTTGVAHANGAVWGQDPVVLDAGLPVGTTSGTVAAGDDSRIVGAAQKSANGSDFPSPGLVRANVHVPALAACQAVAVANIASLSGLPTIDGVTITDPTLGPVLLTGQTTASQDGPWTTAAGAWTRPTDFASGLVVSGGRTCLVMAGTVYAKSEWALSTQAGAITVDTTAQVWTNPYAGSAAGTASRPLAATDATTTNARTPSAHAASHASSGSDAVTLAESQVTNLIPDLAAKAPVDSLPVYVATNHGMKCDDTTDDTAAFSALLATVYAAGGGEVFFPSLALINGQIVIPFNASTMRQPPIRLSGAVTNMAGQTESGDPYPSGGLDLRYAGRTDSGCGCAVGSPIVTDASAVAGDLGFWVLCPGVIPDRAQILAVNPGVGYTLSQGAFTTASAQSFIVCGGKIATYGLGNLELDHLLMIDNGTSSAPFLCTTNTTINRHDCLVLGNPGKSGPACDQDIAVYGGVGDASVLTTALTSGNTYTSLAVSALPCGVSAGDLYIIGVGAHTQIVTVAAPGASLGATTIPVTSFVANANYPTWAPIVGPPGTPSKTPCGIFQGYGSHSDRNEYDRVRRVVAHGWSSDNYFNDDIFWQECGSNLATTPSTLTTALTNGQTGITALAVTALSHAVFAGDTIQLGRGAGGGAVFQIVTASAGAAAGATSISINSFTSNAAYAIGVLVFDTTQGISAAYECYGDYQESSITIKGGRVEMSGGYNYATRFAGDTWNSTASFLDIQDSHPNNIAAHRCEVNAQYNTFIPLMVANHAMTLLDDAGAVSGGMSNQTTLDSRQNCASEFPQGISVNGPSARYYGAQHNLLQTPDGSAPAVQVVADAFNDVYLILNGSANNSIRSALYRQLSLGDVNHPAEVYVLNGLLGVNHILATTAGASPTIATQGGSTSLSIAGQDTAHTVALTTASGVGSGNPLCYVFFAQSYHNPGPNTEPRFAVTPKNKESAAAQPYITGDTYGMYYIALANAPATATALAFDVVVIGS
jgi:hypothetical protein